MPKVNRYNKASVLKDTNRIVCESEFDPLCLRPGARIKFDADSEVYNVARCESFFYITPFEVENSEFLWVKADSSIDLVEGDNIEISYKEYEVESDFKVLNSGRGYSVNDILTIKDGTPCVDLQSQISQYSELKVLAVDESGGVTSIELLSGGKYTKVPDGQVSFGYRPPGGKGSDLEFILTYKLINNRSIIDREIHEIRKEGERYKLLLNNPLPHYIVEGKLSVRKSQIFLSSPYGSESKINSTYSLMTNFTENYRLLFLAENSLSTASIYNEMIIFLDKKLKATEERLSKLENKI